MEYALLGEKLGHSFSPAIHAMIGDYRYELRELPAAALPAFLEARDFLGLNVTIPYKTAVMPYLSHIDERAAEIGAVNTVVNRGGELYGYNTDFDGMCALAARLSLDFTDRLVLVLGSGGTSHTACAVARALGAREVHTVSRRAQAGCITYEQAMRDYAHADILINTTPVGMYPHTDGAPIDISAFLRLSGVLDAVYNPLRTDLVLAARARGIPAEGGLYMLIAQAVYAAHHFGRLEGDPAALIDTLFDRMLASTENIVLIGMPGVGKSTVGRRLAAALGRPLLDTDEEIRRVSGREIPDIFAECGEAGFRDLEARVIAECVSDRTGLVIATGGGAVLREENVRRLSRNGRLYYLSRPLASLKPSGDRPLSRDYAALARRFEERAPIYRAVADAVIEGKDGAPADTAAQVIADFSLHRLPNKPQE